MSAWINLFSISSKRAKVGMLLVASPWRAHIIPMLAIAKVLLVLEYDVFFRHRYALPIHDGRFWCSIPRLERCQVPES